MPADDPAVPGPGGPKKTARQAPPPPAAVMGLLNYLTATSLDQDYEQASRRAGPSRRPTAPGGWALVALAVFGLLVGTAAIQTAQSAGVTQQGHEELVSQVLARKSQLADRRERIDSLTGEVSDLQTEVLGASVEGRALQTTLSRLGVVTGTEPTRGPGVRVLGDNGPSDEPKSEVLDGDLQKLVNGLWIAGAEAISINGERITNLTAVRVAGANITVNLQPVSPPYRVLAIGDPDTLAARFVDTEGGQWWLDLHALYGVTFEIDTEENLTLPAANEPQLRHAHTPEVLR